MARPNANSRRARPRAAVHAEPSTVRALVDFAGALARACGRWLAQQRMRRTTLGRRDKEVGDPVTDLDLAGEARLRARIAKRFPAHGFIGEETGATAIDRSHVWIVDPIDGTANFAAGLSPWGVSVACLRDGVPIAGAIYAYPEDVTIVAGAKLGARVGRAPLLIPPGAQLGPSTVVGMQWLRGDNRIAFVPRLLTTGTRARVFGCTVVQLCDVARGRLQANVQQQGKVWDVAAAGLIVLEAGGRFTGWNGETIFPCAPASLDRHHPSVGAGAKIHGEIIRLLQARPSVSTA